MSELYKGNPHSEMNRLKESGLTLPRSPLRARLKTRDLYDRVSIPGSFSNDVRMDTVLEARRQGLKSGGRQSLENLAGSGFRPGGTMASGRAGMRRESLQNREMIKDFADRRRQSGSSKYGAAFGTDTQLAWPKIRDPFEWWRERCLVPGQTVETINGPVKIEDIVPGELVVTHRGRIREVLQVKKQDYDGLVYKVQAGNNCFTVTDGHRILATQKGVCNWAKVETLRMGDKIFLLDLKNTDMTAPNVTTISRKQRIWNARLEDLSEYITPQEENEIVGIETTISFIRSFNYVGDVYDLTVEDDHSFSAEKVLVRNTWWFNMEDEEEQREKISDWSSDPACQVWMADGTFKRIDEVVVGDEVVGWENNQASKFTVKRRMCSSKVVAIKHRIAPNKIKVTMESGNTTICTDDHMWANYFFSSSEQKRSEHKEVQRREQIDQRMSATDLFDIGFTSKQVAEKMGIPFSTVHHWKTIWSNGGRDSLVTKYKDKDELSNAEYTTSHVGATLYHVVNPVQELTDYTKIAAHFGVRDKVINVEVLGEGPVVSMQTETGNYIADGFASKNCRLMYTTHYLVGSCNTPDAPLWMGDFSFKPIGEVQVGEEVIGWKWEFINKIHQPYLTKSTVIGTQKRWADEVVEVTMESGKTIKCTPDHLWGNYKFYHNLKLTKSPKVDDYWLEQEKRRMKAVPYFREGKTASETARILNEKKTAVQEWKRQWNKYGLIGLKAKKTSKSLHMRQSEEYVTAHVGASLKLFINPTQELEDPKKIQAAYWLGGLYDGEGHRNTIGQSSIVNPEVCQKIRECFEILEIPYKEECRSDGYVTWTFGGETGYKVFSHLQHRDARVKFLNWCKPVKRERLEDMLLKAGYSAEDKVVSVRSLGPGEVVSLQTTSQNYVAWGFGSKNCIDIYAKYPVMDMTFTHKDKGIVRYFESLFLDGLDYQNFVVSLGREFWQVGEVFALGSFNQDIGCWEDDEIINPNDVIVSKNRALRSYNFHMKVPNEIKQLIDTREPYAEFKTLVDIYPDIVNWSREDKEIPVSDVLMQQLRFDCNPWNNHGTPILLRAFRTLMLQESLFAAQDAVCTVYGTPILTKTGITPIQEIEVETEVLTHTGEYHKVIRNMERDYNGPGVTISPFYEKSITSTDEHPFLIRRHLNQLGFCQICQLELPRQSRKDGHADNISKDTVCIQHAKEKVIRKRGSRASYPRGVCRSCDCVAYSNKSSYCEMHDPTNDRTWEGWLAAKDIRSGDEVYHPSQPTEDREKINSGDYLKNTMQPLSIDLTDDILWLVGLHVADGCADKNGLRFSLGLDEMWIANKAKNILEKTFELPAYIYRYKDPNFISVQMNNDHIGLWFRAMCGVKKTKRFPDWAFTLPKEKVTPLIAGWLDGDGATGKERIKGTSSLRTIAEGAARLIRKMGYQSQFNMNKKWPGVGGGGEISCIGYRTREFAEEIGYSERYETTKGIETSQDYSRTYLPTGNAEDGYWVRIHKVKHHHLNEKVYNLEVEKDNSYCAPIISHNCDRLYSPLILATLGLPDVDEDGPFIPEAAELEALRDDLELTMAADFRLMCQPPGTMVTTVLNDRKPSLPGIGGCIEPEYKEVPIENLKEGDKVLSYRYHDTGNKNSRVTKFGNAITSIGSREFNGELVAVSGEGFESRYTPDHLCLVRMGEVFRDKYLVYVMQRGNQFRIGMTGPHFNHSTPHVPLGTANPIRRFIKEKADNLWILDAFSTKSEARKIELLASCRYGLPQVRFSDPQQKANCSTIDVDEFWNEFGDNYESAIACLLAYGRDINWPLYKKPSLKSKRDNRLSHGDRIIEVRACNLLNGMEFPRLDLYSTVSFVPISRCREFYQGPVWSMDVEQNKTYVGDGVITHNCYHHGLDIKSAFGREQMPRMDQDFIRVEQQLLQVFGIAPELLQGGQNSRNYSAGALSRELLAQMMKDWQQKISGFIQARMRPVAEIQGMGEFRGKGIPIMEDVLVVDEETGKQYVERRQKLAYPEVQFPAMNLRDENMERQFIMQLVESGWPISFGSMATNLPIDFDKEREARLKEKVELTVDEQQYKQDLFQRLDALSLPIAPEYAMEFAAWKQNQQAMPQTDSEGNIEQEPPMPYPDISGPPMAPNMTSSPQLQQDESKEAENTMETEQSEMNPQDAAQEQGRQQPPQAHERANETRRHSSKIEKEAEKEISCLDPDFEYDWDSADFNTKIRIATKEKEDAGQAYGTNMDFRTPKKLRKRAKKTFPQGHKIFLDEE